MDIKSFFKNIFSNANEYSATAKEKADDINEMFANKDIDMIWCAKRRRKFK